MSPLLALPVGPRDHMRGPRDPPVTVVEYADAQCPYCGRLEPLLRDLAARRGDVRLVYRHYPLVDVHPFAYSAAPAMEAVGAAGLFWELHDRLFADQDALGRANLARHAEALGLAGEVGLRPASGAWDQRVRDDFDSGVASGVEGTPCFMAAPFLLTNCRYAVEFTSPGAADSSQVRCAALGISWVGLHQRELARSARRRPPGRTSAQPQPARPPARREPGTVRHDADGPGTRARDRPAVVSSGVIRPGVPYGCAELLSEAKVGRVGGSWSSQ